MSYLASHPSSRPDLTFLAEFNGTRTIEESQHLACFDGGNFILGGQVLGRQDITDFGLQLTAACHDTYNSTATRIGPEIFSWNASQVPANQSDFYDSAGFWIEDSSYDLRPEVIESYYYAYQATEDQMYRDWAWDAFVAINSTTRVEYGFTLINDVNTPGGGDKLDYQESFLFAELLKYSYLIQAPVCVRTVPPPFLQRLCCAETDTDTEIQQVPWDVLYQGKNNWVFNTEAHPIKVAGTPI